MANVIQRGETVMRTVPLISVEGTAYECGRAYGEIVLGKYPGYMQYLKEAPLWYNKSRLVISLFEKKAPHVFDIFNGMQSALPRLRQRAATKEKNGGATRHNFSNGGCTSFSTHLTLTLDRTSISGQTKDTSVDSISKYIVLRMRIKNAPTILVLAYPGEVLGYGMWSTGMTIFRNSLYSKGNPQGKLSMVEWGLLALAGESVYEAQEFAEKYGIQDCGNFLITESSGKSISVESNAGGISFIPPKKGINVHANHPVGKETAPFEDFTDKIEKSNSRYRMNFLWKLLNAKRGRLTAQKALMCLSDHSRYPRGICRHKIGERTDMLTSAAVVAEPAKGKLHVVRGNPCANWPVTYEF